MIYLVDSVIHPLNKPGLVSANVVKKQLTDLSSKIKTTIQPALISRKLNEDLKVWEVKPAPVSQQCLLYKFQCNLWNAGYVDYTRGHLHECDDAHKQKSMSICKQYFSKHNSNIPPCKANKRHQLWLTMPSKDCKFVSSIISFKKWKKAFNSYSKTTEIY